MSNEQDLGIRLARANGRIEGLAFFAAQCILHPEVYPHREQIAADLLAAIQDRVAIGKEIQQ